MYNYVQNNPINWIDPNGRNLWSWFLDQIRKELTKSIEKRIAEEIGKEIGDELAGGSDIAIPGQQHEMDSDTDQDGISDFSDQDDDNDGVLDIDDEAPKKPEIWMLPCPL